MEISTKQQTGTKIPVHYELPWDTEVTVYSEDWCNHAGAYEEMIDCGTVVDTASGPDWRDDLREAMICDKCGATALADYEPSEDGGVDRFFDEWQPDPQNDRRRI